MTGDEFLIGEHRRVVDRFIEDAAGMLSEGLSLAERKELEINLRFPAGARPPGGERPAPRGIF